MLYSPIETFIRVIKGKYKAKILIYLARKNRRFSEIKRKFPHMSERILIKQLKELEKEQIVGKIISYCAAFDLRLILLHAADHSL